MSTTSVSLLERIRQPDAGPAWTRFVELYTPLLFQWARQLGLGPEDAADLVQDIFTILIRKLPEFSYNPGQSFRAWLKTVTRNRWRDLCRRRAAVPQGDPLSDVEVPDPTTAFEEADYRQHLVRRALELMQAEFQPVTWKAYWEYLIVGRPAAEVARELGITSNAVYLAKVRVVARLRQDLDGLLD